MDQVDIFAKVPFRGLLYGKYGTGKTTIAGSAGLDPRSAPVFWIDVGGVPQSLVRLGKPKIRIFRLNTIDELTEIYEYFANGQNLNERFAKLNGLQGKYRSIVFDGYTGMQDLSFRAIQGVSHFLPGAITPRPDYDQWGKILSQMVNIASGFYQLPDTHVISTAWEHATQVESVPGNKKTAHPFYEPALKGQALGIAPGWAMNVGRVSNIAQADIGVAMKAHGYTKSAFSLVQFERDSYVDAKNQHLLPHSHFADPTIGTWLDMMGIERSTPAKE